MKFIFTDVDGVLTDERVAIDVHGNETKTVCYRDLDAIGVGRKYGYEFVFVTGEDTDMLRTLAKRFFVERVYAGAKDKLAAINAISVELNLSIKNMVYIGDSDRDAPALKAVGLGIAPCDGTPNAKNSANYVTESEGGRGVLLEVVDKLIAGTLRFPHEGSL